jgi:hypothetical protein
VEDGVGADQAAAELGARGVLAEVGVFVDAGDLGGPFGELLARGGLALGAGGALVDDVVDDAAELVDLLEAVALLGAEEQERELEVRVGALGEAMPQRGRVGERADQVHEASPGHLAVRVRPRRG